MHQVKTTQVDGGDARCVDADEAMIGGDVDAGETELLDKTTPFVFAGNVVVCISDVTIVVVLCVDALDVLALLVVLLKICKASQHSRVLAAGGD